MPYHICYSTDQAKVMRSPLDAVHAAVMVCVFVDLRKIGIIMNMCTMYMQWFVYSLIWVKSEIIMVCIFMDLRKIRIIVYMYAIDPLANSAIMSGNAEQHSNLQERNVNQSAVEILYFGHQDSWISGFWHKFQYPCKNFLTFVHCPWFSCHIRTLLS